MNRETFGGGEMEFTAPETQTEKKENLKKKPRMTLFLLRHGRSEEDKTKSNRGLTELGKDQVTETLGQLVNTVAEEENPQAKNLAEALKDVQFHLRDSGTERTLQQVWLENDLLVHLGVPQDHVNLPQSALDYKERKGKSGPGIAKRLKGVQGLDQNPDFRKKMKSKEFQAEVGAFTDIEAWALAPDDKVPEGVETLSKMQERYRKDVARAERLIPRMTENAQGRIVTIANSHASIATLAAASEMGIPLPDLLKKIGEMPEAQGLRYDFYSEGKEKSVKPFGKDIEPAIEEMGAKK